MEQVKQTLIALTIPIVAVLWLNFSNKGQTYGLNEPYTWTLREYLEYRFFREVTDIVDRWPIRTVAEISLLSDEIDGSSLRDNPELVISLWTAWNTVSSESPYYDPEGQESWKIIKESVLRQGHLKQELAFWEKEIGKEIKLQINWRTLNSY